MAAQNHVLVAVTLRAVVVMVVNLQLKLAGWTIEKFLKNSRFNLTFICFWYSEIHIPKRGKDKARKKKKLKCSSSTVGNVLESAPEDGPQVPESCQHDNDEQLSHKDISTGTLDA